MGDTAEGTADGTADAKPTGESGESLASALPGRTNPRGDRWLYAWGAGNLALGVASLLVPLYVVELGGGAVLLGVLWSVTSLAMVPGGVFVGRLVDRTGQHRLATLAGFGAIGVSLGALALVESFPLVLFLGSVLWFAAAALDPVLSLVLLEHVPETDWSSRLATFATFQQYGYAGGLLLGLVWTTLLGRLLPTLLVQRTLLAASTLLAVAAAVGAGRWLPRRTRGLSRSQRRRLREQLVRLRRTRTWGWSPALAGGLGVATVRRFRPRRLVERFTPALSAYFATAFLFFSGFAVFAAPLPAFLVEFGYSDDVVFGLFVVSTVASAAFAAAASDLVRRYGNHFVQSGALAVRGLVFPAIAMAVLAGAGSLGGAGVLAVLFVASGAAWTAVALTARTIVVQSVPAAIRGEALGVYMGVTALAGALGGVGGGWLAEQVGYLLSFGAAGAMVLAGMVLVLVLARRSGVGAVRAPLSLASGDTDSLD